MKGNEDYLKFVDFINLTKSIYEKTIGSDIEPTKYEDIGEKINEIIQKATDKKYKTNGENGLDGEIHLTKNE